MSAALSRARRVTNRSPSGAAVQSLAIEIVDRAGAWSSLGPIAGKIRRAALAAHKAACAEGVTCTGAVVIALSDAAEVRSLNALYRGKDKPTNVLSFPVAESVRRADPGMPIGDVILSFETVVSEASEKAIGVVDHLQHLVVHGVLHLMGFDHELEADAVSMERIESRIMLSLGVSDPYVVD